MDRNIVQELCEALLSARDLIECGVALVGSERDEFVAKIDAALAKAGFNEGNNGKAV